MAVTATFLADFTSFNAAMERATVKIRDLDAGGLRVAKTLDKMGDAFSGRRIIQDAQLAVKAVEAIGGASKLTAREQDKLNTQITEALEKYRVLGKVAPDSLVAMATATKQVEQQMTLTQKATSLLSGTLAQVAGGFALGTLVTRGISALGNFAGEALRTASALVDASEKTGLTTDTLQRMSFVAKQTGATLEDFTSASFKLGVNLAGGGTSVNAAVQALGLSLGEIQQLNPDEQFERIAASLGQMTDATERNRIGVALFGRQFGTIATAISEGWDQIADRATIASRRQIKALEEAGDKWDAFVSDLKTNAVKAGGAIASFLSPDFVNMSKADAEAKKEQADAISKVATSVQQLTGAQGDLIRIVQASMHPSETFVGQLKAAQEAASSLSETQKKELNAALELGVAAAADLEKQFFKVDGALDIYKKQQQESAEATKRHADIMQRAADDIDKYADKILKAREELEKFRRTSDELPEDPFAGMTVGVQPNLPSTPGLSAQQQRDLMLGTNAAGFGVGGFIPTVQQMQKYRKAAREILTIWQEMTLDMAQSTSDAFGNMLTGIRSFKDGVTDIWHGLQQSVSRYISAIVNSWLSGVALMGGASQAMGGVPMGGGGGGYGYAGAGGALQSAAGAAGGGGGGMGGGSNPFRQLPAGSAWAMYGSPALIGGIAGFSSGYASGSRGAGIGSGVLAGAIAGIPYAGATGGWSIAAGAGAGALGGYFGGTLGKSKDAKAVDAQRSAFIHSLDQVDTATGMVIPGSGAAAIQKALGIAGSGNNSSQGLGLWREFSAAKDFDTLNRTGAIIQGMVTGASRRAIADAQRDPWAGAKGSIGGVPFYANEAFGLKTPRLAVVGDANEPENVVKNSTLKAIAGAGTSDALERLVSRLERYIQDAPRVQARALASALLQAGVTR